MNILQMIIIILAVHAAFILGMISNRDRNPLKVKFFMTSIVSVTTYILLNI